LNWVDVVTDSEWVAVGEVIFTARVSVYFINCCLKMNFSHIDTLTSVDTRAVLMHGAVLGAETSFRC
jgi:hypothetical protein